MAVPFYRYTSVPALYSNGTYYDGRSLPASFKFGIFLRESIKYQSNFKIKSERNQKHAVKRSRICKVMDATCCAMSITHACLVNSKHRLSCRNRYCANIPEMGDFYTVNNVNIVKSCGWLTVC